MSDDAGQDQQRDRVLATYDVVGAPPRQELVALAELAAHVAGVPYAAVDLVDSSGRHRVATAGLDSEDAPAVDATCHEAPLRTPSGVVIGTLCVFDTDTHEVTPVAAQGLAQLADRVVDVLELELASRRLSEADARLSTSNERLAHFAGQVSHDLKNPLTSVSLSLESLEMEISEDFQADTVARARRGVERMAGLINNLLEFASQGAAPGDEVVDLDRELAAALDDLAGRVTRDSVTHDALPRARGDAVQLRSVLMNLIDNAAKFTVEGDQPQIEVAARRIDGHHRIEVRDRGRGIPDDMRERVFAPLARLDKTVDGTGIGLATCRRIVEAHGGSMGVDERPGGGSVFWFDLPLVTD